MKKTAYILFLAMAVAAVSCHKPEYNYFSEDNENVMTLSFRGFVPGDRMTEYPAVVDEESGTVTIYVPYYLSNIEPLQADLKKMRLSASMPLGATFNPPLAGEHDLEAGFKTTLTYADGKTKEYVFYAIYVKSDQAQLTGIILEDEDILYSIGQPEEGKKGNVTLPLDEDTTPFLEKALLKVSPWATVESDAYNPETGIIDLTKGKDITVISQSGEVRSIYEMVYQIPEHVEGLRRVKPLFAFQATTTDPHGMTKNANRSMAVVGDYLILSNALDYTKMPVYDRMTGEYLGDNIVNTSTFATEELTDNMEFWAIAADDADHLVAATFVDSRSESENGTVRIFTWPNGIDAPPVSKEWAGFWHWSTGAAWSFSNMKVVGDVTQNAVIASSSSSGRAVFATIRDGATVANRFNAQIHEGSAWWSSNVIPLNADATSGDDVKFISVSGNFRQYISWNDDFIFNIGADYWYMGGGEYQKNATGGDYILADGHGLFGVLNGWYAGQSDEFQNLQFYYQLVVSDIGETPDANSLTDGLIFASRSSVDDNILSGMGYGVNGMLSPFAFDLGSAVLGPNGIATNKSQFGDVVFAKSSEKKIQVYAMAMNLGVTAYEITYY